MARIAILVAVLFSVAHPSLAADAAPLKQYIEEQVGTMTEVLEGEEGNDREERDCSLYFRRFWLRLRPNVTFTAGIAKIGIVPELELLWQRDLPEGWVPFQPTR